MIYKLLKRGKAVDIKIKNKRKSVENNEKIIQILKKLDELDDSIHFLLEREKEKYLEEKYNREYECYFDTMYILGEDFHSRSEVYKKVIRDLIKYNKNVNYKKVVNLLYLRGKMLQHHIDNKLHRRHTINVIREFYNDVWIDILRTKKET